MLAQRESAYLTLLETVQVGGCVGFAVGVCGRVGVSLRAFVLLLQLCLVI